MRRWPFQWKNSLMGIFSSPKKKIPRAIRFNGTMKSQLQHRLFTICDVTRMTWLYSIVLSAFEIKYRDFQTVDPLRVDSLSTRMRHFPLKLQTFEGIQFPVNVCNFIIWVVQNLLIYKTRLCNRCFFSILTDCLWINRQRPNLFYYAFCNFELAISSKGLLGYFLNEQFATIMHAIWMTWNSIFKWQDDAKFYYVQEIFFFALRQLTIQMIHTTENIIICWGS